MILDLLISRYLDSELTEAEDRELRSITSADPEAREVFDQAVLLHIAMRCEDPEVDVPADLVRDTRNLIFDKIDALPAVRPAAPKSAARRIRSVTAVLALLLVLVLPIEELRREIGGEYRIQNTESDQGIVESQNEGPLRVPQSVPQRVALRVPQSVALRVPQSVAPRVPLQAFAALDVAQALSESSAQSVPQSVPRSVAPSVALRVPQSVPQSVALRAAPSVPQSEDVPLLLTTFYTTSVQGSLESVSAISQISQSIGYGLSEQSYVGLEVGAMQYTVDRVMQTTVRADGGSDVAMRETVIRPASASGGKLSPTSTPTGSFRQESTRITDQQSVAWGAAFYQRPIVSTGAMAMLGRVGVGAGMDGMLAYGRLQAEYRILPILSVTMGAEARYAPMRTGAVSGQQSGQSYGGFLSMVYGIQLSL